MSERIEIGTVEVLRLRIYDVRDGSERTAAVESGAYPLYLDGASIYWEMTGHVSRRHSGGVESLGDGMFLARAGGDEVTDEQVTLPSRTYTRAEFAEFLRTEPVVREGDPEQRLRVRVMVEV